MATASQLKAKGWIQGKMRFTLTMDCRNNLYFKTDANFTAKITKIWSWNGSSWVVNTSTWQGHATIVKSIFWFRGNTRCWSSNQPYLKFKIDDTTYIRTPSYAGGKDGTYCGTGDCTVNRGLLNCALGTTFDVSLKAGKGSPGDSHAFALQSSNPRNESSNAKKVTVEIEFWYDPADDYEKSTLLLSKGTTTAGDSSDPVRLQFVTGKFDSHIYHRVTYWVNSSSSSIQNKSVTTNNIEYSAKTYAFAVDPTWCFAIPDAISGIGYAKLDTYYRYSKAGAADKHLGTSNTVSFVFNVPESAIPTIGSLGVRILPTKINNESEVNAVSQEWINKGCFVQRACGAELRAENIAGVYGSKIKTLMFMDSSFNSYKITVNRNGTETSIPLVSVRDQLIEPSGDIIYSVYVRDSRGRVSETVYTSWYDSATITLAETNGQITESIEPSSRVNAELDDSGNPSPLAITITPYASPAFAIIRTNRVTMRAGSDDQPEYIISEDGTSIEVVAYTSHSSVMTLSQQVEGIYVDENPITLSFRFREKYTVDWVEPKLVDSETGAQTDIHLQDGMAFDYDDHWRPIGEYAKINFDPQTEYDIQFILDDKMTAYMTSKGYRYTVYKSVELGSNECTFYWKRGGLGVGIGQKTQTSMQQRAVEISPDWQIIHGMDDQYVYYVPDIVFTTRNDPKTPRKKIGRIWLKEVD